jgi:iron-sulfur cluster assembly protein
MIQLTQRAAAKVADLLTAEDDSGLGLRVWAASGGCSGLEYRLAFVPGAEPTDIPVSGYGFPVHLDSASVPVLAGVSIDYLEGLQGAGFSFSNPSAAGSCGCGTSFTPDDGAGSSGSDVPADRELVARVEAELDLLRPLLAADGGSAELIGVHGGVAVVRLGGACGGCSLVGATSQAIEQRLLQAVPGIERVIVT